MQRPNPTGREIHFAEQDIIVSKTDLRGIITYANRVFMQVSGYTETELIGMPHNLIRHPQMPRAVFRLLWDSIKGGQEIFAYVLNMAKNGDGYWVFAHVTPSYSNDGRIIGYHSNRRTPQKDALEKVRPLYARMLSAENKQRGTEDQVRAGTQELENALASSGMSYEAFVFSLSARTQLSASIR
jgi:PAS domain S-box-containing protein